MPLYILQYHGLNTVKITGGGDLVFISGHGDSFQRIGTMNRDGAHQRFGVQQSSTALATSDDSESAGGLPWSKSWWRLDRLMESR